MPGLLKSRSRCPVCSERLIYAERLTYRDGSKLGIVRVRWTFHHELKGKTRTPPHEAILADRDSSILSRRLHVHDPRRIRSVMRGRGL